jgi:RNA polymerase sigma factor (TIGR02999 family)
LINAIQLLPNSLVTVRTSEPSLRLIDRSLLASTPDHLTEAFGGDRASIDRLLPELYDQLNRLARSKLRSERVDHTLDTSALVHEAYLKLSGNTQVEWKSRSHFLAVAAIAMRRVLIDYAKGRNAQRRGGRGTVHVTLDGQVAGTLSGALESLDLLQLETSLTRLAAFNPRGADVVQYRFFAGLTYEEIAEVMGVSVPTVRRSWSVAKAWLAREMA